jgi:autotransporter-associated beta strand protein
VFTGHSSAPATETLGRLTAGTGLGMIHVQPDPAQPATLTFESFSYGTNGLGGALTFLGERLGATAGPGVASVRFTTVPALVGGGGAAGSTTLSLVPFAFGGHSEATGFVTYGSNGIRPLDDSEYLDDSFAQNSNVRLTKAVVLSQPAFVNSLKLEPGAQLSGPGRIELGSGMIFAGKSGAVSLASSGLHLGGAKPLIFNAGELAIHATVSGAGAGFRKRGAGRLVLGASKTYAGPTVVEEGILRIENAGALGAAGSPNDGTTIRWRSSLELSGGIGVGAEVLTNEGRIRNLAGDNAWSGEVLILGDVHVDSGSLSFTGAVSGDLRKSGPGTLYIPGIPMRAHRGPNVSGGTLVLTGTGSAATQGFPGSGGLTVSNSRVLFAPAGSGSDVSHSLGTIDGIIYRGAATIGLARGAQNSLTIHSSAGGPPYYSASRYPGDTLLFAPSSGELGAGENVKFHTAPTLAYGLYSPAVLLQRADADASAAFLSYSSNAGLVRATPSASTDLQTAGSTAVFVATAPQSLNSPAAVLALANHGQTIDLRGHTLTIGGYNGYPVPPSGLILNGGTITGGALNFIGGEALIYTSRANATITSHVGCESATFSDLTLSGPGTLTLAGTSNFGDVRVTSGALELHGTLSGNLRLQRTARLTGTGRITGALVGGQISPGTGGAGILTAGTLDYFDRDAGFAHLGYPSFAFELGKTGLPDFGARTDSGNDLLRLTSAGYWSPLWSAVVDVYFNTGEALQLDDTFYGGFYMDSSADFRSRIKDATYRYYEVDPQGLFEFEGQSYSLVDDYAFQMSTVPQVADFGSGAVNGYIMELRVIPEPSSAALLSFTLAGLASLRWRARRA